MDDPDTQIVMGLKDPWKFLFVDMDIAMAAACFGFGLLTMGLPTPVVVAGGGALGYVMHKARKGKPKGRDILKQGRPSLHGRPLIGRPEAQGPVVILRSLRGRFKAPGSRPGH